MFQTNLAKSFKFLKNINVLGETNACLTQKWAQFFVIIAIQNNYKLFQLSGDSLSINSYLNNRLPYTNTV